MQTKASNISRRLFQDVGQIWALIWYSCQCQVEIGESLLQIDDMDSIGLTTASNVSADEIHFTYVTWLSFTGPSHGRAVEANFEEIWSCIPISTI